MKIAVQQLIFGASYLCLFRATLGNSIASSSCEGSRCNMSTAAAEPSQDISYVPGSSSVAFITTPDETSAKKLARTLVERKLSVCVNIVPKITSIYVWEDKVNEDSECMMIVKTRTSRINDLTKFVRENHPYSVAEVITMPISKGNPPYMAWIQRSMPDADEANES